MPHPPRHDEPGCLYHVTNRGMSGRTAFERPREVRVVLYPMACAVRRGWIEILAFTFLTNHFHFLVRSLNGHLSETIRLAELSLTWYYHLRFGRRGPFFESRFKSQHVDSVVYRNDVVRYNDLNAVKARLTTSPFEHPFCSAYHYMRGTEPIWLDTQWLARIMAGLNRSDQSRAEFYAHYFHGMDLPDPSRYVETRLTHRGAGSDDLDLLLGAAPALVLEWLRRRTWLADASQPGLPVADTWTVSSVVEAWRERDPEWTCNPSGRRPRTAWPLAATAMLRDLCGAGYAEIGRLLGCSAPSARDRCAAHVRCFEHEARYRQRIAALATACLEACHGPDPGLSIGI